VTRLHDSLMELIDVSSPARINVCSDLALLVASANPTITELEYSISLLWILNLHRMVVILDGYLSNEQRERLPVGIQMLILVSKTRSVKQQAGRMPFSHEYSLLISTATDIADRYKDAGDYSNEAFARMGVAHVAYIAWSRERSRHPDVAAHWAHTSFESGQHAANALPPGSLTWSFAVNHCAYIGVRTKLFGPQALMFMDLLITDIPREFDHYRFRDTQAWEFTATVERAFDAGEVNVLAPGATSAPLCAALTKAHSILDEAQSFGDEEVRKHRELIAHYASRLHCGELLTQIAKATLAREAARDRGRADFLQG
jgi:hypothetical protein